MTDVDALTAFIRARLADEERDAQMAAQGLWRLDVAMAATNDALRRLTDPAAILARVAALRALVDWNAEWGTFTVLRHVAAIWRDHSDYQPEWATDG